MFQGGADSCLSLHVPAGMLQSRDSHPSNSLSNRKVESIFAYDIESTEGDER